MEQIQHVCLAFKLVLPEQAAHYLILAAFQVALQQFFSLARAAGLAKHQG